MAEEAAVAVCVRLRPLSSRENELGEATHVYWKTDSNAVYQVDGSKSFNFDRVFHNNETTKNVYEEIAVPIIDSAIQGYNGTIFAYGQTASGKTHTMMGSKDCLGVIPRAIHDIFQKIKKFPDREFLLRVSYMEIYNETITDLLCSAQKMKPLIVREDINRNVYVADLTEEVVYTSEMALNWITKGEKNRHYGITKMNERSSRSHTIFRMILESREKGEPSNCDGSIKVSHLNLVDLAGSERAAQTGAEGVRLKEGCNINRSLFILGQVIKKLSDGQIGGFINYRDSKLTRILQNSLGGNAKTRIICTITPASFEETLSTLQFASTAKYMKNTPYVNEVSSDEALLKRYRKEIVDLKRQLEEVNVKTRAQEMEKDQLAQLLDEKDLLQKVQDEKIHNLTRMLVTSSSLTLQQELKAKRKRRVTWCFGKINKMKDSNYVKEFSMPANVTTRTPRNALAPLGEIDESFCLESDTFSNTLDTLTEIEWNSATKLLNEENLESEFTSLRAKYDNLVLDYEQLRRENEEMGLKLKEKNDLDEFETLERKTEKDQEMQLIHEIANLKNLVKHAEVYNQDLENELSLNVELLREKEAEIKNLKNYIDSQKSENAPPDLPFSSENSDDLKQMKQSLFDAETVALDAKRESAFLRSENLELKEKMKELANTCKQMEIDTQLYQSQLEAKKKMQVDLEKELQSAFNEITKLTSLVDGKLPKDVLCNLELERRIADLQKELSKEVKENEALQKEINSLSELKSLPPEVETLRKEIQGKLEELCMVTSERDRLCSEVTQKESRIQGLLEEIGETKEDLTAAQLNYQNTEQELQNFKILHTELEQKHKLVQEENERVNQEVESLSREAENLRLSLDAVKTELSHNTPELQQKAAEGQERLLEVEQLKEELERRDAQLRATEEEKALVTKRLQHTLEEVCSLAREKEALSQLRDSLQAERDQLHSDIQDTVGMNIDTQEQLRNALESLRQHQETINTLKMRISEETSRNLRTEEDVRETERESHQKMIGVDEKQNLEAKRTGALTADVVDSEVAEQQKKISSLIQEKNELQQMLESIIAEKEQLRTDLKENIEMTIENQEELRILGDELKKQQEIVAQEKNCAIKKDKELARTCERLAEVEEKLKEKNEQLQEKEQQLLNTQEEMSAMQRKVNEVETLKNELKNQEARLEHMETERRELAQKLHENCEEMKATARERNALRELRESLEVERDQLKEQISRMEAAVLQKQEELRIAHVNLKEYQETTDELRRLVSEKTDEVSNMKIDLENSSAELQEKIQKLKTNENLLFKLKEDVSETQKQLKDQSLTLSKMEMENLNLAQKLHENLEEIKSVAKERDHLRSIEEALTLERNQLRKALQEAAARDLEAQQELKIAHEHLKEQQETIEKFRERLSEKTTWISNMQKSLDQSKDELQEKIQELQQKELQLLKVKEDVNKSHKKLNEMEQLRQQFEAHTVSVPSMDVDNLYLTKKLHENLEEIRTVAKENSKLRRMKESLERDRGQFREAGRKVVASSSSQSSPRCDLSDRRPCRKAVHSGRMLPGGGEQPLLGSLKEKGLRIGELLKRYSEMRNQYECLNGLSLDLEKELVIKEDLSTRVKANLSLPYPETKQFQKLLATNLNRSMEFQRVIKKLKNELSYAAEIKEEEHGSINKFEMALIDEVEKQDELYLKMRLLQQEDAGPSSESRHRKLNELLDMHIEEILKDFSKNDFPSIKIELQQILNNRKEMIRFLEEWLSTHFDTEKLKNGLQEEYESICQVNSFYNNKITAMINESSEFEERSAARRREWEQYLESAREESKALLRDCEVLAASSVSGAHGDPATQANRSPQLTQGAMQLATEKIQGLEISLREAKESAVHKEDKIIKMQKEIEMSHDIIAKLQAKVNESNKFLEKSNEMIQALQDKAALGAKPYKEEIEDLKTKLVKLDLEKKQTAKEFEKKMTSARTTIEHQDEVIRRLKENLRRNQQVQDTSMVTEPRDTQPPQKPLTCGGGSGIVQNTKALILKSGYLRLEKELAGLKQQNERLEQQKSKLLSTNQQLSNEVKAWKERTLNREAPQEVTCGNLPDPPAQVPGTPKKRQDIPAQCGERNAQAPMPKDSPKARFFDPRSKSFPGPRPVRYFDNSSLGLSPEKQAADAENVDPRVLPSASLRDAPECRMQ
ncbi:PREDICTED: centromere-associated protein E isoform X2 [Chinchilla lanigera]|uniref:centromere-associated protein E isoform X2 n=1 Tax=Chinchilla lanigera TaxID=34839 RepID=UPI0006961B17|nr:PREDICTED: centromere-associated protein E isoform X2 [Chinchilla lanigera]